TLQHPLPQCVPAGIGLAQRLELLLRHQGSQNRQHPLVVETAQGVTLRSRKMFLVTSAPTYPAAGFGPTIRSQQWPPIGMCVARHAPAAVAWRPAQLDPDQRPPKVESDTDRWPHPG